ncbi:uncharacterized protein LOC122319866 [Drosophila ficusphila]|uniref:uncharacterized protein LOC122319866 n=1 Tax=Drosophila ficusphila TaxID=30025 RepID=UPI001C893BE0|nr:uncharacterized protein LOC122319866 [Drosophila ficusphila]
MSLRLPSCPKPEEPCTSKAAAARRPPPKPSAGTLSVPKASEGSAKQPPSISTAPLTGTHTSHAEAAKRVRVAVLPEDFPQVHLSHEELSELEEAIMDDVITSAWDTAVAFRGIHFRVGYLLIDCLDQDSADWLRAVLPLLRTWKGVPLETKVGEDIPAAYNVFCPRSSERENEELLTMLGRQNSLETDAWGVVSRRNDGGGALLVIGIDQLTRDEIVARGHQLNFRYGTVSVSGLRKAAKMAAIEGAPSGPPDGKVEVEESLDEPQEPMGTDEDPGAVTDVRNEDEKHPTPSDNNDETEADVTLTDGSGGEHPPPSPNIEHPLQ